MSGSRPTPLAQRFWNYVAKSGPNDCWLWTNVLRRDGYGEIGKGGADHGKILAHRVAWALEYGQLPPPEIKVLHKCDVRHCVNPNHLFLGSQADNIADMKAKGRARGLRGFDHPSCKLSPDDVAEILSSKGTGVTQRSIAKKFGVSPTHIYRLWLGRHAYSLDS